MLFLESNDTKGERVNLTVTTTGGSLPETYIRIWRPDGKAQFSGEIIASAVLTKEQVAELKRHL
jgi:hypothetical protein